MVSTLSRVCSVYIHQPYEKNNVIPDTQPQMPASKSIIETTITIINEILNNFYPLEHCVHLYYIAIRTW